MSTVILLSGGMDSFISRRLFYPKATPVFVDTGSRYTEHDLACAVQQEPNLSVLHMPRLREWANGVVPHRNALLLAYVANRYAAEHVVVSAPRGELIWDQQPAFHRAMNKVLRGTSIVNPLRHLTKTQAVELALLRGVDPVEMVNFTRSCYSDQAQQCGQCPACVKRWISLVNNGLSELYTYDPRVTARHLAELGTVGHLWRYGLAPTLEAWRALRRGA